MDQDMTRAEQNLLLLQSVIPRGEQLWISGYDASGRLVASSCPESLRPTLNRAFVALGGLDKIRALPRDTERPHILGSSIGMQWAVTREDARGETLLFVIGPVFYTAPDGKRLRAAFMTERTERGSAWISALCDRLEAVPVMAYAVFSRYVLMVHNTLTGQQLGLEVFSEERGLPRPIREVPAGERNRMQVYQAEQALLDMVRTGNINYQSALQNSISISPGVPVKGRDPLRQMKTSITVFATLASRAAMEGGLSPEVAYSLGDSYIQAAEDCRDSGELSALAHAMYHDFIYRVHYVRTNPNYSHAVQKCCDFIELSLDRRIRTADLAALVGYTEYYLTEKFKKETGRSVSAYIRNAKIGRAKILLESTALPVAEIAERLAFNTPNYFIQCFRAAVGTTPAQYRKARG